MVFLFGMVFTYPLNICIKKFALNNLEIEPEYPFIKILNGLLFVLLYRNLGLNIHVSIYYIFLSLVLFLVYIDISYKVVPDKVNFFLLVLGLFNLFIYRNYHFFVMDSIRGMLLVSAPLLVASSFGKGFGGGDIKLFAVSGLLLGSQMIFTTAFLSMTIASIYGIFLIFVKKKSIRYELAFVPFMFIGLILSVLYSNEILLLSLDILDYVLPF